MAVQSKLKEVREKKQISVEELAKRTRVSRSMIYDIEARNNLPGIDVAYRLADALGGTITDIFPYQASA